MAPSVSDGTLLSMAKEANAVPITCDKDFGELVYRQGRAVAGVMLLRLHGLPPAAKADLVAEFLAEHAEDVEGAFTILLPGVGLRKMQGRGSRIEPLREYVRCTPRARRVHPRRQDEPLDDGASFYAHYLEVNKPPDCRHEQGAGKGVRRMVRMVRSLVR